MHNRFKFEKIKLINYFKYNKHKNEISDAIYLQLKKSKWSLLRKKIFKDYFK